MATRTTMGTTMGTFTPATNTPITAPHTGHASHAHTPAPSVPAEPIDLAEGTPSLLMRSAGARVAGALLMIGVLWLAVVWALMEHAP